MPDKDVEGGSPVSTLEVNQVGAQRRGAQRTALDVDPERPNEPYDEIPDEHEHFSQRAPWLRAGVLGANDGLVSVASLMLGVGGGSDSLHIVVLAGVAGLIGGALSMAVGEYISVSSQRDAEEADVEKERLEQAKGPAHRAHELDELAKIYEARGVSPGLARMVAEELTAKDVIKAHARDELGIDLDEMSNPLQAAGASAVAFCVGAGVPLLAAAFIHDYVWRLVSLVLASTAALLFFGMLGAGLGGASLWRGGLRVVVGGCLAMGITYGFGRAFGLSAGSG
ncbi:hypothetical protein WJX81_008565 [Elliptochloris bilobata]|uniref:Uncharacterized protein n=1 Tax=Elliptochloris bilobata TaxID=381761 RepID=A0AAW1SJ37_9CHLO